MKKMKDIVGVLIVTCALGIGAASLIHGQTDSVECKESGKVIKEPLLFGVDNFGEESEDIVFTFLRKYETTRILAFFKTYGITGEDDASSIGSEISDWEIKSSLYRWLLATLSDSIDMEKFHSPDEDSIKWYEVKKELYNSNDITSVFKFQSSIFKDWPGHFEEALLVGAIAYDMTRVFQELFGPEVEIEMFKALALSYAYDRSLYFDAQGSCFFKDCGLLHREIIHPLIERALARYGFTGQELKEFLDGPIEMIYDEAKEDLKQFVERNKDDLEKIERTLVKALPVRKTIKTCLNVRNREFCKTRTVNAINSLSDIIPYINSLSEAISDAEAVEKQDSEVI